MGTTTKEPVKLRQRKTSKGLTSLYLDIYYKGKRQYEYLRMYLIPEHSRADASANRETLKYAEAIRAKRLVELRNGVYGFKHDSPVMSFFDYYDRLMEVKKRTSANGKVESWQSALKMLHQYEKRADITFADTTPEWCKGFRDFLDTTTTCADHHPLSQNTKAHYFETFRSCFAHALKDHLIASNPVQDLANFKKREGTRMYLTLDELKILASTPCKYDNVRRPFLFSCLTGLRYSDIIKLAWGDVHQQGAYTRIIFRQKKTQEQQYLDINQQAVDLMGKPGKPGDRVFVGMFNTNYCNSLLQRWVDSAGIKKKITFHCGRHTFATLMLDLGTDIYTVSKLLGHTNVATTQVYAKVLDKNKQKAVSSIPDILNF